MLSLHTRPGRGARALAVLLFGLLLLLGRADAEALAPQQSYAIEVPGLGPLMLYGRDAKSAVHDYVEGLIRRNVFPGSEKVLRKWERSLPLDQAKPMSMVQPEGTPISGILLNSISDLTGIPKRARGPGAVLKGLTNASVFPVFLPVAGAKKNIVKELDAIDHLFLIGGDDYHPSTYGQPITHAHVNELNLLRDLHELAVIGVAKKLKLDVDAICRGEQGLGISDQASFTQDLALDGITPIAHAGKGFVPTPHAVKIEPGSAFAKTIGKLTIDEVPSMHHQALLSNGLEMKVVGRSPDNVVEVVEGYGGRIRGYQFHPEADLESDYSRRIFKSVATRAKAKQILRAKR